MDGSLPEVVGSPSGSDMAETCRIWPKIGQIWQDQIEKSHIQWGLAAFLVVESVGSVEIEFRCKGQPTRWNQVGYLKNRCRPVMGVELDGFGSGRLEIRVGQVHS